MKRSRNFAPIHLTLLQVPAQSTTGSLSLRGQPEGLMKKVSRKSPRLRLDANSYLELHRQVLERDGWRCQFCGSMRSEEHTSELQSLRHLVCRLLLEKKKKRQR